jgi:hypothetical protein
MALNALTNMKWVDGPKNRQYEGYSAPLLEDWRAWAVKKGYKDETISPLITLEEKGVRPKTIERSKPFATKSTPLRAAPISPAPEGDVTKKGAFTPKTVPGDR